MDTVFRLRRSVSGMVHCLASRSDVLSWSDVLSGSALPKVSTDTRSARPFRLRSRRDSEGRRQDTSLGFAGGLSPGRSMVHATNTAAEAGNLLGQSKTARQKTAVTPKRQ